MINLHVLGADGSGKTSDVIDAIDWAVAHRDQFNIRVINLSLGHPVQESYLDDPLCQAAQRAIDAGIMVVAAAGNFGKMEDGRPIVGGIVSPGNTPSVLTVGAMNTKDTPQRSDDVMATYSSRGPTAIDGDVKPDLVAPGNLVVSAAAPDSYLATTYPEHVVAGKGAARLYRAERHEHGDGGRLRGGGAGAGVAPAPDAGAGQGRPAADEQPSRGGRADRGRGGEPECAGGGCAGAGGCANAI